MNPLMSFAKSALDELSATAPPEAKLNAILCILSSFVLVVYMLAPSAYTLLALFLDRELTQSSPAWLVLAFSALLAFFAFCVHSYRLTQRI